MFEIPDGYLLFPPPFEDSNQKRIGPFLVLSWTSFWYYVFFYVYEKVKNDTSCTKEHTMLTVILYVYSVILLINMWKVLRVMQ